MGILNFELPTGLIGGRLVWKFNCNHKFDVGSFNEISRGSRYVLVGVFMEEHLV